MNLSKLNEQTNDEPKAPPNDETKQALAEHNDPWSPPDESIVEPDNDLEQNHELMEDRLKTSQDEAVAASDLKKAMSTEHRQQI